jgi:SAM-dependent methyltransferase
MKPIVERRGLRFPDETVVRHFFRSNGHTRPGRVLELGCGNGSNLECYTAFGHSITGVDISERSLEDARWNFEGQEEWIAHDLSKSFPILSGAFDTILMPSSMYYIPRASFIACLQGLSQYLSAEVAFLIRMRTLADYRFGRGAEVERNGYLLSTNETGEQGLLNVFYTEHEICELLRRYLGASDFHILHIQFESDRPGGGVIFNSDVIISGIIRR